MADKYFTVVFKIENQQAFNPLAKQLTEAFANEHLFHGAEITGCGEGDCMSLYDNLLAHCEEENYYVPDELKG